MCVCLFFRFTVVWICIYDCDIVQAISLLILQSLREITNNLFISKNLFHGNVFLLWNIFFTLSRPEYQLRILHGGTDYTDNYGSSYLTLAQCTLFHTNNHWNWRMLLSKSAFWCVGSMKYDFFWKKIPSHLWSKTLVAS